MDEIWCVYDEKRDMYARLLRFVPLDCFEVSMGPQLFAGSNNMSCVKLKPTQSLS